MNDSSLSSSKAEGMRKIQLEGFLLLFRRIFFVELFTNVFKCLRSPVLSIISYLNRTAITLLSSAPFGIKRDSSSFSGKNTVSEVKLNTLFFFLLQCFVDRKHAEDT